MSGGIPEDQLPAVVEALVAQLREAGARQMALQRLTLSVIAEVLAQTPDGLAFLDRVRVRALAPLPLSDPESYAQEIRTALERMLDLLEEVPPPPHPPGV